MLAVSSGALIRFSTNRIDSAKRLITRYGAVELMMEKRLQLEDFSKLTELHEAVKSVHVPYELCNYTTSAHVRDIARSIELSERNGAKNFVLHLSHGVKPDRAVRLIEPIISERWKIKIALENGHEGHFAYFEPFMGVVKKYNLRICFDIAHAFLNDMSFFERFKAFKDRVVQLHISDLNESGMHAALCNGQRDWRNLFQKIGYHGYGVLEYGLNRWRTDPTMRNLSKLMDTDLTMLRKFGF